jgi:hypothetical protein
MASAPDFAGPPAAGALPDQPGAAADQGNHQGVSWFGAAAEFVSVQP